MEFAYIRVSSREQNEARQIDTMLAMGISEENIFIDKASGKNTDRPAYQLLKIKLRAGDTVTFDSITRLSRNMSDIKKEYEWFVQQGIGLQFVAEPMLNTKAGSSSNDVMQRAVSEIILTLLAAFAEKERTDIKQRQAEGIAAARRRGQRLGRPAITYATLDSQHRAVFHAQYKRWKDGKQTAVQAFTNAGFTKSTWYKIVKEYEKAAQ